MRVSDTELFCEYCKKKLTGDKTENHHFRVLGGQWHHDSNNNPHFLCNVCHRRIHELGLILRWLKSINRNVEDFADDAIKLKAMYRRYGY